MNQHHSKITVSQTQWIEPRIDMDDLTVDNFLNDIFSYYAKDNHFFFSDMQKDDQLILISLLSKKHDIPFAFMYDANDAGLESKLHKAFIELCQHDDRDASYHFLATFKAYVVSQFETGAQSVIDEFCNEKSSQYTQRGDE